VLRTLSTTSGITSVGVGVGVWTLGEPDPDGVGVTVATPNSDGWARRTWVEEAKTGFSSFLTSGCGGSHPYRRTGRWSN
jgi:hypothetical protein